MHDPNGLTVHPVGESVFVSWLYDEGVSGTLELTPDLALDLAKALKAAGLSIKGDNQTKGT
jgi:hypothetical protein